jgi:acetyltransferase-like isoleucine patch superfamily enzyme
MPFLENQNQSFRILIDQIIEHFIIYSPSHWVFSRLRCKYYLKKLKAGSGKFFSCYGLWIWHPQNVFIGNNVYFNRNVLIGGVPHPDSSIYIGEGCLFGPNVIIVSGEHNYDHPILSTRDAGVLVGPVIIEKNCWIGGNVTITKGIKIGEGSVIGANSVVTKDIPPFSLAAGCPAEILKQTTKNSGVLGSQQ